MDMRLRDLARALALLVALLAIGQGAEACECSTTPDAASALSRDDAVFRGRVSSVRDRLGPARRTWYWVKGWFSNRPLHDDSEGYLACCGLEATLDVTGSWKGVSKQQVQVVTGRGAGDCGFVFERGVEYLVYARKLSSGDLATDICTRTKPLARAAEDLTILGDGKADDRQTGSPNGVHGQSRRTTGL